MGHSHCNLQGKVEAEGQAPGSRTLQEGWSLGQGSIASQATGTLESGPVLASDVWVSTTGRCHGEGQGQETHRGVTHIRSGLLVS